MKRYLFTTIVLVIIVLAYIASPFISVYNFAKSLQSGEEVALEKHIDFQPLRESIKFQLETFLKIRMQKETGNKIATDFALMFADNFLDNMLVYYASPRGLSSLIQNGNDIKRNVKTVKVKKSGNSEVSDSGATLKSVKKSKSISNKQNSKQYDNKNIFQQNIVKSMHFTNFDEFSVKVLPPHQSKSILLVFNRQGFSWKLTNIDISTVLYD